MRRFSRFPISFVSSFVYSDGLTLLSVIEKLRKKVAVLIDSHNSLIEHINQIEDYIEGLNGELESKFADYAQAQDEKLLLLRAEMLELISESSSGGAIYNPTSGVIEPVSKVVSDVYDNVRVHAYFAKDIDDLDMTVKQIEGKDYQARHFDLSPLDNTNDYLRT